MLSDSFFSFFPLLLLIDILYDSSSFCNSSIFFIPAK